ncbi:MAG TPA: hypothetical protein VFF13_05370 [archaeon]|nr:hypothetical protein [archaeon]
MGIYDSGIDINLPKELNGDKVKPILLAVAALIVVFLVGHFILKGFDSNPVSIEFAKNPIKTGETAEVTVVIQNNTETDAQNATVSLQIKETSEFSVFPKNEGFNGTINVLSQNTSRRIGYFANPVGNVLPGTYTIVAKFTINGKIFEKSEKLFVED